MSPFGDMTLWNILVSCVVLPLYRPTQHDQTDAVGTQTLRGPRDILDGRRSPLHLDTIHNRPDACYLMPRSCALRACDVDDTTAQITLRVQSTQTSAPCPLCATPAQRIHIDYGRTPADLPWAQYRVFLQLRVRKWFCRNAPVTAASSPNGCPPSRPPGHGAPCGSRSAFSPSAEPLGGRLGCTSATSGPGGEPQHPAPRTAPASPPCRSPPPPPPLSVDAAPAETAHLWHHPGRSGAPPPRGTPPESHRRDLGAVAARAPGWR